MARKNKLTNIEYNIVETYAILYEVDQYNSSNDVSLASQALTSWQTGFDTEGDAVEYMEEITKKYDNRDRADWTLDEPPRSFYVVKQHIIRKDWS